MSELQFASGEHTISPPSGARIFMLSGDQKGREYNLSTETTRIGRSVANDIVIADPQASRRHLEISKEGNRYIAVDLGSANGFYLNDQVTKRATLNNGDIITIGLVRMQVLMGNAQPFSPTAPGIKTGEIPKTTLDSQLPPTTLLASAPTGSLSGTAMPPSATQEQGAIVNNPPGVIFGQDLEEINLNNRNSTTFGRELRGNDIILDNPQVSRHHARVINHNGMYIISDMRSTNGTFVNDRPITADTSLNDGDIVNIGPFRYMFTKGELWRNPDDDNIRVDALSLRKQINPKLNILQDISFTILPREFVAIVGGSGTGKSTLLDAVSGVREATSGEVLYNKSPYYNSKDIYRTAIGYVPQEDIVPQDLTVYSALYYAAKLRLPPDTPEKIVQERIDEVIDDLDLEERRNVAIRVLSGGQRKRVSIAAELLCKPSILFLDEPTSGLDPGLEKRMMELLRKLADQGRTVILITHATENVGLCDRVLFLAKGGYVTFYGTPDEALNYFGAKKFPEIYNKLEQEKSPKAWADEFINSQAYNKNVASRLRAVSDYAGQYNIPMVSGVTAPLTAPVLTAPKFHSANEPVPVLKQFFILTRRYFKSFTNDTRNLLILLLQAPIIALMMIIVFRQSDWDLKNGDLGNTRTLVFLLAVVAVWFGTSNSAREIVKEAAIYRRERLIGLKIVPYIFSKLVIQTLLITVQMLILLGIVWGVIGLGNPSLQTLGWIFLTLFLTGLSAITLGLLLSAINSNSDRVGSFVPLVLIPQIIFSGAIVSLQDMGPVGTAISHLMAVKWGYQSLGSLSGLDNIPLQPIKFTGPPPELATQLENLFGGSLRYIAPDWFLFPTREYEFNIVVTNNWIFLGIIALVCLAGTFVFQLLKDRKFDR